MHRLVGLLAVVATLLLMTGTGVAGARVALVIGNAQYQNVGRLTNPVNDATDLATVLKRMGFEVTLLTDLDYNGMRKALQAFGKQAAGADTAMVYYAGHGVEIDNRNFLVPTDAVLESDRDVALEAISLDLVTEAVNGAKFLRVVVLDACRNNPFLQRMVRTGASRSIGRGLGALEPTGGTLVAYSAKGGTVAADGSGRNSPFMASLLANIETPGLDVSLMFRKVRDEVMQATSNEQEPFTYGSLPGVEVYLVPPLPRPQLVLQQETPPVMPKGSEQEEFAWSLVKESGAAGKVQEFLFTYSDGIHVKEAIALLKSLQQQPALPVVPAVTAPTLLPTPAEPKEAETPEIKLDGPILVMAIQQELIRAGCEPGNSDGVWGGQSKGALAKFGRSAGLALPHSPSQILLETLRGRRGTKCVADVPRETVQTPTAPVVKTPSFAWQSLGEGDCRSHDIGKSNGSANPAASYCNQAAIDSGHTTAVCWPAGGNGSNAWCTYKSVPAQSCSGGRHPGTLYACVTR